MFPTYKNTDFTKVRAYKKVIQEYYCVIGFEILYLQAYNLRNINIDLE